MTASIAPWADRTGRILLAICSIATFGALAQGIQQMIDSSDEQLMTEAWRTLAYVVFAGLWAMLAVWPRGQRGVWELVLFHKIAITVFALAVIDVPTAKQHVVIDGSLVVATAAAYFLCRGWYSWRRQV
ncbi:hypothetical protein [Plantactinospora sp. WMMB782]|uniref:hypothetical protein n=1 Tax=Plantactinospora sp. WMMB782 TaxID=3404121 RepID=UPI003B95A987